MTIPVPRFSFWLVGVVASSICPVSKLILACCCDSYGITFRVLGLGFPLKGSNRGCLKSGSHSISHSLRIEREDPLACASGIAAWKQECPQKDGPGHANVRFRWCPLGPPPPEPASRRRLNADRSRRASGEPTSSPPSSGPSTSPPSGASRGPGAQDLATKTCGSWENGSLPEFLDFTFFWVWTILVYQMNSSGFSPSEKVRIGSIFSVSHTCWHCLTLGETPR